MWSMEETLNRLPHSVQKKHRPVGRTPFTGALGNPTTTRATAASNLCWIHVWVSDGTTYDCESTLDRPRSWRDAGTRSRIGHYCCGFPHQRASCHNTVRV